MKSFNLVVASLPLLVLVSCANPQATTQDKKAELCTNLARFNTSVATLKSLSPNSTVGDFRKARDQVKTAFNEVKTSAQAVQEAKIVDLEAAENNLDKAISKVPNNATLQQATQSVAPQVAAVESAQQQMQSGLGCS
jgi:predicted Zn-dependent protease